MPRKLPQAPDAAFAMIEAAAAAGARCPQADHGLQTAVVSALAHAGRIKVEVFAHNWRQVTMLTGTHRGKKTMACPHHNNGPYMTIDKSGTRRAGRLLIDKSGTRRAGRLLEPPGDRGSKAEREARLKLRPYAGAEK